MGDVKEDTQKSSNFWKIFWRVVGIVFILVVGFAAYAYFFIINPSFVTKPVIEKPEIEYVTNTMSSLINNTSQELVIFPKHILFLLNEIGAYKLHATLGGEAPRLKFILKDKGKNYYFEVINNELIEKASLENPDIIIGADQATIIEVYNQKDTKTAIMEHYHSGKLELEMIADIQTLALKGYNGLANYFGITGFSIFS